MSNSSSISTELSAPRALEAALISLGFARSDDGTLSAPAGSNVTLAPIGQFLELRIVVEGSTVVRAVLHRSALKFCRAEVKL